MRLPGPAPTSCITCRQRKKKCDKARPGCHRCTEGGYQCLGYKRGKLPGSHGGSARPREDTLSLSHAGSAQAIEAILTLPQVANSEVAQNIILNFTSQELLRRQLLSFPLARPQNHLNPCPQPSSGSLVYGTVMSCASGGDSAAEAPKDTDDFNTSDEEEEPPYSICDAQYRVSLVHNAQRYTAADLESEISYSLPPKFIPAPHMSGVSIRFIMSQYEPFFELVYFRPVQLHINHIRGRFVTRIMSSEITRCALYIGAEMFRTLRQDREYADVERFVPVLDRLAQLSLVDRDDVNLDDLVGRLSGALEITFLKHLTSSAKTSYSLLRNVAPLFMQVAFADPTLWPRDPSSNGISLAHVLESPFYDLGRFVFIDATTSMMFGTPPLVEYDTSHPITRSDGLYSSDLIHGCPPEFLFSILRITQWRVRHGNGCLDENSSWKGIEDETWAWRSMSDYGPDSESSRLVMRFAIQESWRHALLIYLYMGMCGVTSHDPRVQSSVRQISRLHFTINTQATSKIHLKVPFLVAGACTRSEFDRRKFRAAVSESGHKKTWLTKPMDIGCILDHLWRGAGAEGAPVTWDDYVSSRKATMNVGA